MSERPEPDSHDIREALTRILASQGFQTAGRPRQILQYVVEQSLRGDADSIRAKSIALDVYGYSVDEIADRETAVRVDAGRLRRRLEEYYAGEGCADPVVISLPKGSYAPSFKAVRPSVEPTAGLDGFPAASKTPAGQRRRGVLVSAFALSLLCVTGFAVWNAQPPVPQGAQPGATELARKRVATYEASPARLLAVNLAATGRDVIFPAVDPHRLRAALAIFEAAIEADEGYFGGHAGAAQVLVIQSLLAMDKDRADSLLVDAENNLLDAERLGPDAAWTHSARASVDWANRRFDEAVATSTVALSLAPDDLHLLEFHALIALYAGAFEEVIETVTALQAQERFPVGTVFGNALGAAYFHEGDPRRSVDTFEAVVAAGGPAGPLTLAYQAAGYEQLGISGKAARKAEQLMATWPDLPLDRLFLKLFDDPLHAEQLTSALSQAGWQPPDR
ncbi:hypothetical protein [Roseibium sp.]|uniref:hypothetical protein n=1 Tax=Roseibium sp. TaxID=1936156 RepID=UPI003BB1088D